MRARPLPSVERVRALYDYDPATGLFRWKGGKLHLRGQIAGTLSNGYVVLWIDGQQYGAHRIAWVHFYGREPVDQIDHRNRGRADNWIDNLREANNTGNSANKGPNKNNTHGTKGVTRAHGRWQAQIKIDYQNHYLGIFDTPEEAHAAYLAKANEVFGEFARGA